jgi:hypothetical protein
MISFLKNEEKIDDMYRKDTIPIPCLIGNAASLSSFFRRSSQNPSRSGNDLEIRSFALEQSVVIFSSMLFQCKNAGRFINY